MTSLILENADLNRLFPKCRPRGGPPPAPGASTQSSQQPHDSPCQTEAAAITTTVTAATTATTAVTIASTNTSTSASAISDDMIDLERDTSDRQVKPIYPSEGRGKRRRSGVLDRINRANSASTTKKSWWIWILQSNIPVDSISNICRHVSEIDVDIL